MLIELVRWQLDFSQVVKVGYCPSGGLGNDQTLN